MVKVPEYIRNKPGKLNAYERILIQRHPIHSLDLLQNIPHLPFTTPFIAYQVHERHDGRGYPRRRKARTIHDYAKIVAIADIYDALTCERPYRQKLTPFRAMEGVLKICCQRSIDQKFLRAFINATSVFPLASFVLLGGNKIGKVVATTEQMTKPIVRLLIQDGQNIDGNIILNLTDDGTPQVIRSIDKQHLPQHSDLMLSF